jgi:hypothetical protein
MKFFNFSLKKGEDGSVEGLAVLEMDCSFPIDEESIKVYTNPNDVLNNFPFFVSVNWGIHKGEEGEFLDVVIEPSKLDVVLIFGNIDVLKFNGKEFVGGLDVYYGNGFILISNCYGYIVVPIQSSQDSQNSRSNFDLSALRVVLEDVLKDANLVRVERDCPYIPLRSLNGKDGSIYRDGEYLTLGKLDRTFRVLGSFSLVKDTDLGSTVAYVLGLDDNNPSLVIPYPILKSLMGA